MRRTMLKLKRECEFVIQNAGCIAAAVFLCCLGGILLWINGGSWRFTLFSKDAYGVSLTASFVLWLIVYAVYGFRVSVKWISCRCRDSRTLLMITAVLLAYLLDLVWYVLFFCTHLSVFPLIILTAALCLNTWELIFSRKGMILQKAGDISVIIIELLYIKFTVMSYLLK